MCRFDHERVGCGIIASRMRTGSHSSATACTAKDDYDRLFLLLRTIECGSFGPVGKCLTAVGFFPFATVFWLMAWRLANTLTPS